MHERTDGVTLSLLELLIAAKNQCPADPVEFSKALKHIMALQNSYDFRTLCYICSYCIKLSNQIKRMNKVGTSLSTSSLTYNLFFIFLLLWSKLSCIPQNSTLGWLKDSFDGLKLLRPDSHCFCLFSFNQLSTLPGSVFFCEVVVIVVVMG